MTKLVRSGVRGSVYQVFDDREVFVGVVGKVLDLVNCCLLSNYDGSLNKWCMIVPNGIVNHFYFGSTRFDALRAARSCGMIR